MASLAKTLGLGLSELESLATQANNLYRVAKEIEKADGTIRRTYDARKPLKQVQQQIKRAILDTVFYPTYLTGSLKGRDHKLNASLHSQAKIVISEDISQFFPSTTANITNAIWRNFFGFSSEVSNCLTQLTTLNNELPQGASTSPQLANLVFWRNEPRLQVELAAMGLTYSRFVDDIAASSQTTITDECKTSAIAAIYRLLKRYGYKPKREKHSIVTAKDRMVVTKLTINQKPSLAKKAQSKIRSKVHHLVAQTAEGIAGVNSPKDIARVSGHVEHLARFNPGKAAVLKKQLKAIKALADASTNP